MSIDSDKYLISLFKQLGLDDEEIPGDRELQLTLIISEIIRNAMYSLFILERVDEGQLPSTASLNHFVRRKSEALLSGIYSAEEINDEINSLLKHAKRKEENRYSPNFYDLGLILNVRPGRIEHAPMRAIESEYLPDPILVSSWPTKILRQMGLDLSVSGLSHNATESSISELEIESQPIQEYCDVPPLWKSASKQDTDNGKMIEILKNLPQRIKFTEWKEQVKDCDIDVFKEEYGTLRWQEEGGHRYFDKIYFPNRKFPIDEMENRWAIFKTTKADSYDRTRSFWLFITGSKSRWENGSVISIPGELITYVVRLFAGRSKINILQGESNGHSRFSVGGAPPPAAQRLLHSLRARGIVEPGKPLTYEIRTKYLKPVINLLCKDFLYELEEGS